MSQTKSTVAKAVVVAQAAVAKTAVAKTAVAHARSVVSAKVAAAVGHGRGVRGVDRRGGQDGSVRD